MVGLGDELAEMGVYYGVAPVILDFVALLALLKVVFDLVLGEILLRILHLIILDNSSANNLTHLHIKTLIPSSTQAPPTSGTSPPPHQSRSHAAYRARDACRGGA